MAAMRMWHVTVQNMEEDSSDAYRDEYGRISCKFVVHPMPGLTVDQFEDAMTLEMIKAVRQIKREMIMKGMEP
jgi:hypothetical protein